MSSLFLTRLIDSLPSGSTGICCGLDLDPARVPSEFNHGGPAAEELLAFVHEVVSITSPHVSCYKIQKAFLEHYSDLSVQDLVAVVRKGAATTPTILDCKVGDIGNTMRGYLDIYFGEWGFDGIVMNPYMGRDVWSGLPNWPDRGAIVLVRSSNPGSASLQRARLLDGREVWRLVLDELLAGWHQGLTLIPVMSVFDLESLRVACDALPPEVPVFIAGVGAQGGSVDGLRDAIGAERRALINSSRALVFPYDPSEDSWRDQTRDAVTSLVRALGR